MSGHFGCGFAALGSWRLERENNYRNYRRQDHHLARPARAREARETFGGGGQIRTVDAADMSREDSDESC